MGIRQSLFQGYWLVGWLLGVIAITAASIIPSFNPPGPFDKELHFISYFLLALIPIARLSNRKIAFMLSGFMPVLGFVLEYLQRNISGREFSPEDMIANNLGAIAGIVVGMILRLSRRLKNIAGRSS